MIDVSGTSASPFVSRQVSVSKCQDAEGQDLRCVLGLVVAQVVVEAARLLVMLGELDVQGRTGRVHVEVGLGDARLCDGLH